MLPGSNLEIQTDLAYKQFGLIVEFVPRVKFNKGSVPHIIDCFQIPAN